MRHRNGPRKLNRTTSHRLAMLRNMCNSLIKHEAIKTTLPKAKELRSVVEPLITLGKVPTLANRRLAFNRTRDRDVVAKLFNELGPALPGAPGRLHAHPEDGFPRRRQRADGLRRTGRPTRARRRSGGGRQRRMTTSREIGYTARLSRGVEQPGSSLGS